MAEYKTFLFIGLVIATIAAVASAGNLVQFQWQPGNAELARTVFNSTLGSIIDVFGNLPVVGGYAETAMYVIISFFAFKTGVPLISAILSNGFTFMAMYMIYLFLKDRGV